MNMRIGLVVNPIAGVGAELAWKGTDDVEAAWDVVDRGGVQPVWDVVNRALESISEIDEIDWFIGGNYPLNISGDLVYEPPQRSHAQDTHRAVVEFAERKVELILFAGGDGTAADVAQHSENIPILGIPAGVKIFSPTFLHRPEDLGDFLRKWEGDSVEVDILDLDEDAYRAGQAKSKLVTSAIIPISPTIQQGKISWSSADSSTFELIAERIKEENWLRGTILVGPGSTMKNIFAELGLDLSLLGVDVVRDGKILVLDATTEELRPLQIDEIWLSPIGNQGHILGRGNRQIPVELIMKLGKQRIRVFSSVEKIRNTPVLFVDSGDNGVDKTLKGYLSVIVGYHEEIMRKVV